MRHRNGNVKLGRNSSHRAALFVNQLKSLIEHETIETTVAKAKELRRHADRVITLAKKQDLSSRRLISARLRLRYNPLTPKEARGARQGDLSAYNTDRKVLKKLYDQLVPRFVARAGGYTRIVRYRNRVGDQAPTCILQYLPE